MKRRIGLALVVLCLVTVDALQADAPEIGSSQNVSEKETNSVVRNKRYYKAGKIEFGGNAGLLPYDSTFTQYVLGGRLAWHINDHYAWEILDFQYPLSSVSSFTTSLVSDSSKQIVNLQALKMKMVVGTGLLMSPLYGKIRFLGQIIYLDIYFTLGVGMVNTETLRYSYQAPSSYTETSVAGGWDPSLNYGLGFKFFATNLFTVFFDLRSYMTYSTVYGRKGLHNNFTTSLGISFFLPTFG